MKEILEYTDQIVGLFWSVFPIYLAIAYHKKIYYSYAGNDGILNTNELSKAIIAGLTIFVVIAMVLYDYKEITLALILLSALFLMAGLEPLTNLINYVIRKRENNDKPKNDTQSAK